MLQHEHCANFHIDAIHVVYVSLADNLDGTASSSLPMNTKANDTESALAQNASENIFANHFLVRLERSAKNAWEAIC